MKGATIGSAQHSNSSPEATGSEKGSPDSKGAGKQHPKGSQKGSPASKGPGKNAQQAKGSQKGAPDSKGSGKNTQQAKGSEKGAPTGKGGGKNAQQAKGSAIKGAENGKGGGKNTQQAKGSEKGTGNGKGGGKNTQQTKGSGKGAEGGKGGGKTMQGSDTATPGSAGSGKSKGKSSTKAATDENSAERQSALKRPQEHTEDTPSKPVCRRVSFSSEVSTSPGQPLNPWICLTCNHCACMIEALDRQPPMTAPQKSSLSIAGFVETPIGFEAYRVWGFGRCLGNLASDAKPLSINW